MVSKSFEGQTDKTEEWYGTQYKQESISDEVIKVRCSSLGLQMGTIKLIYLVVKNTCRIQRTKSLSKVTVDYGTCHNVQWPSVNGLFKHYSVIINLCSYNIAKRPPHCIGFKPDITIDFIVPFQNWQNADLNGKFKLPMKNEFIPTNFEIYPLEKDSPSYPTLIKVFFFLKLNCLPCFPKPLHLFTAGSTLFTFIKTLA